MYHPNIPSTSRLVHQVLEHFGAERLVCHCDFVQTLWGALIAVDAIFAAVTVSHCLFLSFLRIALLCVFTGGSMEARCRVRAVNLKGHHTQRSSCPCCSTRILVAAVQRAEIDICLRIYRSRICENSCRDVCSNYLNDVKIWGH